MPSRVRKTASLPKGLLGSPAPVPSNPSCASLARAAAAGPESRRTFRARAPGSSARRLSKIGASSKRARDFPAPPRSPCVARGPYRRSGTSPGQVERFAGASDRCIQPVWSERVATMARAPFRISGKRPDNPRVLPGPLGKRKHSSPRALPQAPHCSASFRARRRVQGTQRGRPRD